VDALAMAMEHDIARPQPDAVPDRSSVMMRRERYEDPTWSQREESHV